MLLLNHASYLDGKSSIHLESRGLNNQSCKLSWTVFLKTQSLYRIMNGKDHDHQKKRGECEKCRNVIQIFHMVHDFPRTKPWHPNQDHCHNIQSENPSIAYKMIHPLIKQAYLTCNYELAITHNKTNVKTTTWWSQDQPLGLFCL